MLVKGNINQTCFPYLLLVHVFVPFGQTYAYTAWHKNQSVSVLSSEDSDIKHIKHTSIFMREMNLIIYLCKITTQPFIYIGAT